MPTPTAPPYSSRDRRLYPGLSSSVSTLSLEQEIREIDTNMRQLSFVPNQEPNVRGDWDEDEDQEETDLFANYADETLRWSMTTVGALTLIDLQGAPG